MARRTTSSVDGSIDAPLSFGQERLWLSYLLQPRSPMYNVPVVLHLQGELDVRALELSLAAIVERHDALRTRIDVVDGEPRQRVAPATPVRLVVTDLSHTPGSPGWDRAMELVTVETDRPFDLRRGPLFRASLITLGPRESLFIFVVHHIAFDGWSRDIFLDELATLYGQFQAGETPPPADAPPSYTDYAVRQRAEMGSSAATEGHGFWRDLLAGDPETLELPTDHLRPKVRSFAGHT